MAVLCAALIAGLLTGVHGAPTASAVEPSAGQGGRDFPSLPRHCFHPTATGAPAPVACRVTRFDSDRPTLVLWGDSHAQQYLPPIRAALRPRDVNLVAFVSGGCPAAFVPRRAEGYPNCEAKNRAALDWVRAHRDLGQEVTVLLGSAWSRWRQFYRVVRDDERAGRAPQLDEAIVRLIRLSHDGTPPLFRALGNLNVQVDVIGGSGVTPVDGKPPCPEGEYPYRCPLPRSDVIQDEAGTTRFLGRLMARLSGRPLLIDTSSAYCNADVCLGTVNGIGTFYDSAHLSASLTRTMTSYFVPTARRAAGRG